MHKFCTKSKFLSTLSLRRATTLSIKNTAESKKFLSTLSLRRATLTPARMLSRLLISIHALLAESDCFGRCHCWGLNEFLSTLSLRRATLINTYHRIFGEGISIHALLAESDTGTLDPKKYDRTFLSTLSLRRATAKP